MHSGMKLVCLLTAQWRPYTLRVVTQPVLDGLREGRCAVIHGCQMHGRSDQYWSFSTNHAHKHARQLIPDLQGGHQEVMCQQILTVPRASFRPCVIQLMNMVYGCMLGPLRLVYAETGSEIQSCRLYSMIRCEAAVHLEGKYQKPRSRSCVKYSILSSVAI